MPPCPPSLGLGLGLQYYRAGGPSLDPLSLSPALWLDASDASTLYSGASLAAPDGSISEWRDKSGNNRHATQTTGVSQPLRKTSIQNGRDVVRFDGSNDVLNGDFGQTYSQPFTCIVVTRKNGNTDVNGRVFNTNSLADGTGISSLPLAANSIGNFVINYGTSAEPVVAFGTSWALFESVGNGVSSLVRRNASQVLSPFNAGYNGLQRYFSIGNLIQTARAYNGDIAEILIFPTTLSDGDRQAVESYLNAKWNLYTP